MLELMCHPPQSCCASRRIRTQPVPQVVLSGDALATVGDLVKVVMHAASSWDLKGAEGARMRTEKEMRALPKRWCDGAPPPSPSLCVHAVRAVVSVAAQERGKLPRT